MANARGIAYGTMSESAALRTSRTRSTVRETQKRSHAFAPPEEKFRGREREGYGHGSGLVVSPEAVDLSHSPQVAREIPRDALHDHETLPYW